MSALSGLEPNGNIGKVVTEMDIQDGSIFKHYNLLTVHLLRALT